MRKSLEETWRYLESQGEEAPRRPDGQPFVPEAMPNYDDEELGFSYFRYRLEDADNSNLTLPRTFFGRSGFTRVCFTNTDLSNSRMCWNDFEDCDFTAADLSGCDMRASNFVRCKFNSASLRGADLRLSSFEDCDFIGADLTNAVADAAETSIYYIRDYLSEEQQRTIEWATEECPEPPGG